MKRGLFVFPVLTLLIKFVSAQFFSSYGRFSLSSFFSSIDPATLTLGILFFVLFALIFYASSRIFKNPYGEPNKGIAATIAGGISLLAVYGIYRSGFRLENFFYNIGISTDIIYFIVAVVFIILAIFLIKKIKVQGFLILLGLLLIVLAVFTDFFYEKFTASIIGIVLMIIGLFLWRWSKRKKSRKNLKNFNPGYGPSPQPYPNDYGRREKEIEDRLIRKRQKEREIERENKRRRKIAKKEKRNKKSLYSPGMRRGGLKSTRSRFVSKRAVERYARRFGVEAAKKRFG